MRTRKPHFFIAFVAIFGLVIVFVIAVSFFNSFFTAISFALGNRPQEAGPSVLGPSQILFVCSGYQRDATEDGYVFYDVRPLGDLSTQDLLHASSSHAYLSNVSIPSFFNEMKRDHEKSMSQWLLPRATIFVSRFTENGELQYEILSDVHFIELRPCSRLQN